MRRRQTMPTQWLIADRRLGRELWNTLADVPRGAGVLVLRPLSPGEWRRLRRLAAQRELTVIVEGTRTACRVHDAHELRRAMLARAPLICLSPLYPTRSHPDWPPLPRMRAAALARLGRRGLFALGGMDQRRFRRVERLGFIGWAGIDAFRT